MSIQGTVNSAIGMATTIAGINKLGNTMGNNQAVANMQAKLYDQQKAYQADMAVAYNMMGAKNVKAAFINRLSSVHNGDFNGYMLSLSKEINDYEVKH